MMTFIYEATKNYQNLNLTLTEVENACNQFNKLMKEEYLAIQVNFFYEYEMTEFDFYGAKNFSQAKSNFDLSSSCVLNSVDFYLSSLIAHQNSTLSSDLVKDYVNKLFSSHSCQPNNKRK
jgi:hypothetical protein